MLRVYQLCDQERSSAVSNGEAETYQKSSGNKHSNVDCSRLEDNANDHDDASGDDTSTTTKDIGDVWSNWKSHNRADRLDGVQETSSSRARVVECLGILSATRSIGDRVLGDSYISAIPREPVDRSSYSHHIHWWQT